MYQTAHEVRSIRRTHDLNPPSQLLALEPRYMFDAAALVTAEAVVSNAVPTIVATDDSYTDPFYSAALATAEDTSIDIPAFVMVFNDGDFGLSIDSVATIPGQTNGTVELLGNGSIRFTPDQNFNGEASFTYSITNDLGDSDTATVTLFVTPQDDAPTTSGIDNLEVTTETSSSALDLAAFFSDADQNSSSLTYSIQSNSNPALFSTAPSIDESGQLILNYAPSATGSATFTIQALDNLGTSVETSFTVTVANSFTPLANSFTPIVNDTTVIVTPSNISPLGLPGSNGGGDTGGATTGGVDSTSILSDALNEITSESGTESTGTDTDTGLDFISQENFLAGFFNNDSPQQQALDAAAIQQIIAQGGDPTAIAPATAAGTAQTVSSLSQHIKGETEAFNAERAEILSVLRNAAQFLQCAIQK